MSLYKARVAFGCLERGAPAADHPALWSRTSGALDKAGGRILIEGAASRRKLEAGLARCRRLRVEIKGVRLSRCPRQGRLL